MAKGTSRAEVMLNSKKIKPITLAVIELRLSEGISQSFTRNLKKNSVAIESISGRAEGLFGLGFTCFIVVREKLG